MSTSLGDDGPISRSPDLSRRAPLGQSRTISVRACELESLQCSQSRIEFMPHADAHDTPFIKNEELMSPCGSRLARPFALSPGPSSSPITPLHSAISDQFLPHTADQDVLLRELLSRWPISHPGSSPIHGHHVSLPSTLGSSQLSSSSTRHAAINSHSTRPRTSNQVFNNISDLAAHYGIPQFLPVAPRTTPRRLTDLEEVLPSQSTESHSSSPDFANLCSNYLNMLSQNSADHGASDVPAGDSAPMVSAPDVTDADAIRSLMDVLNATPELQTCNDLNEFLTSPLIDSPFDDDLLTTPAVGSDMNADILTSPLLDFGDDSFSEFPPLFSGFSGTPYQESKAPQNEHRATLFDHMFTIDTPLTPLVDTPSVSPLDRRMADPVPGKRKSSATGTRKNITPESLVPVDAPIQSRKYLTPSTTSRKELPATWRRKRQRTAGPGEEVDQLVEDEPSPTPSEQEQIEAKRRQNTIAARRSRKRKLEYQRELEDNLERHKRESEMWKQRALTCQALLRSHHIECPEFPDL